MGKVLAGPLMQDSLSTYFDVLVDPASGTTYAKRAANLHTSANGDYADPTAVLYGPDGNQLMPAAAALNESVANPTTTLIGAAQMLYNDTTGLWERQRGNVAGTLLANGTRTATTTSPIQTNNGLCKGVMLWLRTTSASGTGGLQALIQGIDPISGQPCALNSGPAAITTNNTFAYALYPGISTVVGGGSTLVAVWSGVLPRLWQVQVVHNDASSYTYTLGFSLIN